MEKYRKALWSMTIAVAMVLDFTVIPLSWIPLGYNLQISLAVGAFFACIVAPLTARWFIGRYAWDKNTGFYYVYELETLITASGFAIKWCNPAGWLGMLLAWCGLGMLKYGPSWLCAFIAIFVPEPPHGWK